MHVEYVFRISAADYSIKSKKLEQHQFSLNDVNLKFFDLFHFSCQTQGMVQVPCHYHYWFQFIGDLTRNPDNENTPHLRFVIYLETGLSQRHQFDINVSNERLQSNIYSRAIFAKIINGAKGFIVDLELGSKYAPEVLNATKCQVIIFIILFKVS